MADTDITIPETIERAFLKIKNKYKNDPYSDEASINEHIEFLRTQYKQMIKAGLTLEDLGIPVHKVHKLEEYIFNTNTNTNIPVFHQNYSQLSKYPVLKKKLNQKLQNMPTLNLGPPANSVNTSNKTYRLSNKKRKQRHSRKTRRGNK